MIAVLEYLQMYLWDCLVMNLSSKTQMKCTLVWKLITLKTYEAENCFDIYVSLD